MLILTRDNTHKHVRLTVGREVVWVSLVEIDRGRVRLGFTADAGSVEILRDELLPAVDQFGVMAERWVPADDRKQIPESERLPGIKLGDAP